MNADTIVYYILTALAVLITLTVHEFSHGYAAYKLGDTSAKDSGRLTLNPIKHIDPIGALCMLLFHFGWAKPVPVDLRNFKKPKRDFAITALAGPLSNLIFSVISAFLYLLTFKLFSGVTTDSPFIFALMQNTVKFLYILHAVNIGLAIFNLIPIPPLDGSRLLAVILPERLYYKLLDNERKIYFALLGWLLLGDIVKGALLSVPFIAANPILSFIAGIFSLSDMIGFAIDGLSGLILQLFSLIPFLQI